MFLLVSWADLQLAIDTSRAEDPATSQSQFGATATIATLLSDEPITGIPSPGVVDQWPSVRLAAIAMVVAAVAAASSPFGPPRGRTWTPCRSPMRYSSAAQACSRIPYLLGASHDYRQVFLLPGAVRAPSRGWPQQPRSGHLAACRGRGGYPRQHAHRLPP